MRSSFFVILSLLAHAICVAAIALAPRNSVEPSGQEIEVNVGQAAQQPGTANAEPALEPVKPIARAAAPTPKKHAAKVKKTQAPVVAAVSEPSETTEASPIAEETPPSEPTAEPIAAEQPAPSTDDSTEASSKDVNQTPDPTPAMATAVAEVATGLAPTGSGTDTSTAPEELGKGGATQAGAVSVTELKQAQGNKPPSYPVMARKEGRSGTVELLYRVTKEGLVADVEVAQSSGHKDLDSAAVKAIAKFRFVPGQEGWARHPVAFNLKGNAEQLPGRLRSATAE